MIKESVIENSVESYLKIIEIQKDVIKKKEDHIFLLKQLINNQDEMIKYIKEKLK